MRHLLLASAVTLCSLAACTGARGPAAPMGRSALSAAPGIEDAAARAEAIAFIRAYAAAPQDGGRALMSTVGGSLAEDWAHWLSVQNAAFPGSIVGRAQITSIGIPDLLAPSVTGTTQPTVVVDVRAAVTFTYTTAGGVSPPSPQARSLDGGMVLSATGAGQWRVQDFTRDGRPLDSFMILYPGPGTVRSGIEVNLDNVIIGTSGWQFALSVKNGAGGTIVLDPSHSALVMDRTPVPGRTHSTFTPIPPGAGAEGFVTFPVPTGSGQPAVVLRFTLRARAIDIAVAFQDPRQASASPSPSPSG